MAAVTLSGCFGIQSRKEQALSMLRERYNDEFKITSFRVGGNRNKATVVSKSHPDLPFTAYFNTDGKSFGDTYAARVLAKNICDDFQNECGETGKMYFYASIYPAYNISDKVDYTLEEWLEEGGCLLNVSLFVSEVVDPDALYEGLQRGFKKLAGVDGHFSYYRVDEELQKKVEVWFTEHTSTAEGFTYVMDETPKLADFSDGKLEIEKERFVTYWAW